MFVETILADAVRIQQESRKPTSGIAGQWQNRLGSTLDLTVDTHHHLSGTFRTGVGVPDKGSTFPVVGFAERDAVTFCVDFGSLGSVASWSGHHVTDDGGERLVTLWHLARPATDPHREADVWASLLAGADHFSRVD